MAHQKRGAKAIDKIGILPNYQGIAVHKAKNKNKNHLTKNQIAKFTKNYEKIIKAAQNYYPLTNKNIQKARGRPKQEKGKNLLDRLLKYENETLRFLNDFRMIKVKEKISGSFASFFGGEMFFRIRG